MANKLTVYSLTPVLWTKVWDTKPHAIETVAKNLIKAEGQADINQGKLVYSLDEALALLERCYARAGSSTPAKKAKLTWANYARPGKQSWFVEVK
jgi:hypothetical protein